MRISKLNLYVSKHPGGEFLTYELPIIDKNIHPLHPKKPANLDKLIKIEDFKNQFIYEDLK